MQIERERRGSDFEIILLSLLSRFSHIFLLLLLSFGLYSEKMFDLDDDRFSFDEEKHRKTIRRAFDSSLMTSKDGLNKTEFKCAWLYLFGYKISKV